MLRMFLEISELFISPLQRSSSRKRWLRKRRRRCTTPLATQKVRVIRRSRQRFVSRRRNTVEHTEVSFEPTVKYFSLLTYCSTKQIAWHLCWTTCPWRWKILRFMGKPCHSAKNIATRWNGLVGWGILTIVTWIFLHTGIPRFFDCSYETYFPQLGKDQQRTPSSRFTNLLIFLWECANGKSLFCLLLTVNSHFLLAVCNRVSAKVDNMGINGIPVQGVAPSLLTSQTGGEAAPLLNAAFETNPMDGLCDQRVKLTTRPVEICYDAVSAVLILSPCKEIVSVILPCLCQNTLFLVAEYNQQSGGILQAARIGSLETVSCLKLTNTLGSSEFSLWGGGGLWTHLRPTKEKVKLNCWSCPVAPWFPNCCFSRLQAAAMAKFEDLKEQTATGIQHAIDVHKYTDISIDLQPSYIIIPHGGTDKGWAQL